MRVKFVVMGEPFRQGEHDGSGIRDGIHRDVIALEGAHEGFGHAVALRALNRGGQRLQADLAGNLMNRALRRSFADSHPRLVIGARIPPRMEEAARRFNGSVLPRPGDSDGTAPGVHHLEDGLALEAWFDDPPDLVTLLDEARSLLAAIETWSQAEFPSRSWYGARRGALILAYAKLCRIGLWPARSSDDLLVKMEVERLVSERGDDPDSMRALVEIALGVGRRIARQGSRFVTRLSGIEL